MSDRVLLYGAPSALVLDFNIFDTDGNQLTSIVGTETGVGTAVYYVTFPHGYVTAYYDIVVMYGISAIGGMTIYWDGVDVVTNNSDITAKAVWEETATDHITAGTMGAKMNSIDLVIMLLNILYKYEKNRTVVDKTAKTLTIYDDDLVTPIQVFNLKDFNGIASIDEIAERVPV